ncbi:hypothetical protein PIB30_007171 [Stylosanthes scabra]|uniref:Uncharacterized protein n=1 Tax=Stylosanthes scabra TaxID=79078 RepID=A0ABU6U633_9FABA|nr:hypothetical protein [Stylosanthes scabra]
MRYFSWPGASGKGPTRSIPYVPNGRSAEIGVIFSGDIGRQVISEIDIDGSLTVPWIRERFPDPSFMLASISGGASLWLDKSRLFGNSLLGNPCKLLGFGLPLPEMIPSKLSRMTPVPPEVVGDEPSTCNFHSVWLLEYASDGLVSSDDDGVTSEVLPESSCRDKERVCQFLNLCLSEFSLVQNSADERYRGSSFIGFERTGGFDSMDLNLRKASSHSGAHSKLIPFLISKKAGWARELKNCFALLRIDLNSSLGYHEP